MKKYALTPSREIKRETMDRFGKYQKIALFSSVFLGTYFNILFFRPYQLASQIGWLDPWTAVGFGDVFPSTPYTWHYYKESRFFSILYQWILTHINPSHYLSVQAIVIAFCGSLVFFLLKKFLKSGLISFVLTQIVTLSYLLWGDSAGGADYYNTLGNVFILLTLINTFLFYSKRVTGKQLRWPSISLGALSYITLVEVPSGLVVVFCIQLSLIIWSWKFSNRDFITWIRFHAKLSIFQGLGVLSVLTFQSIALILLGQSPIRLMSGPKFLFDSLTNSRTQENWWRSLNFNDFLDSNYLRAFMVMGVMNFIIFVILFLTVRGRGSRLPLSPSSQFLVNGSFSYSITWVILLVLQIFGKSVALTLEYFTTPFLVIGLIYLLLFVAYVISNYSKVHFIPTWIPILLASFCGLMPVVSPVLPSLSHSQDFHECERVRLEFRNSALHLADDIDRQFGARGTLLMGAEDSVFEKRFDSKCPSLDQRPVSEAIMSISQLGFPGVSILGPVKGSEGFPDYPRQYLARPFEREVLPNGCVLIWADKGSTDSKNFLIMNLGGELMKLKVVCS